MLIKMREKRLTFEGILGFEGKNLAELTARKKLESSTIDKLKNNFTIVLSFTHIFSSKIVLSTS